MPTGGNEVWLVVLGAVLAMLTTIVVELLKYWFENKNKTKDFKIIVRLELRGLIPAIDRLMDGYGARQYFTFIDIEELKKVTERADRIREKITLLKNDLKKEEVLEAINDVFVFASDANTLERAAFAEATPGGPAVLPWHHDTFRQQRQMLAIQSVDLKRKLHDLITYLENR